MPVSIIETNLSNANLAAALDYARRGWRVFPCYTPLPEPRRVGFGSSAIVCCSCGSSKCTYPGNCGKHPRTKHGHKDATRDAAIIRDWWARWPDANIGLATGGGLTVIDVDPRHKGDKTLAALERKNGRLPDSAKAISGGGGPHYYLTLPKGVAIASASNKLGAGIDVKADNGYVIAPPSLHGSGKSYHWLRGVMPAKIPPAPDWIVKLMLDGSARVAKSGAAGDRPTVKTAGHVIGQIYAKLLGAKDCGTSWKFDCPARPHKSPDARMYPRADGTVCLKCFSSNPCSQNEIAAAIEEMIKR